MMIGLDVVTLAVGARSEHESGIKGARCRVPVAARWWRGWGRPGGGATLTQHTEGTLIIDGLVWRGRGITTVSDDEQECLAQLRRTITAVLDRFPHEVP
jgi:hypothetical protein